MTSSTLLTLVAGSALAGTILLFTMPGGGGGEGDKPASAAAETPAENVLLNITLRRSGLDPASLAAAGLNGDSVTSVAAAVSSYLIHNPNITETADTNYESAKMAASILRRTVEQGIATQEKLQQYTAAAASLATATAARESVMNSIFDAGTANLPSTQKSALVQIKTNQAFGLPAPYAVKAAEEGALVALRDALATQRICEQLGETLPDSTSQLLQTWDADPVIALAKSSSAANMASVTTEWNAAIQQ